MPDVSARQSGRVGQIVTFYSFKGGTGRTMALANVAWILAANGMRVLVADWDLESPGLHRFFQPFMEPEVSRTAGRRRFHPWVRVGDRREPTDRGAAETNRTLGAGTITGLIEEHVRR